MGVSTVTAARILKGQLQHGQGEESLLEMDKFPFVALAKVSPRGAHGDTTPTARSQAGGIERAEIRSGAGKGSWLRCPLAVPGAARGNGNGGQEEPPGCRMPRDPPSSPGVVLLNKTF